MFPPEAKSKVRWLRIKSERKIELGKLVCKLSIFSLGALNKDTDSVGVKMVSGCYRKKNSCKTILSDLSRLCCICQDGRLIVKCVIRWCKNWGKLSKSSLVCTCYDLSLNLWDWSHNLPFKCSLVWKSTSHSLGFINNWSLLLLFCHNHKFLFGISVISQGNIVWHRWHIEPFTMGMCPHEDESWQDDLLDVSASKTYSLPAHSQTTGLCVILYTHYSWLNSQRTHTYLMYSHKMNFHSY